MLASCSTGRRVPRDHQVTDVGERRPAHRVLIIYYDARIGKHPLMREVKRQNCRVVYDYKILNAMAIQLPERLTMKRARKVFRRVEGVLQVTEDRMLQLDDPRGVAVGR